MSLQCQTWVYEKSETFGSDRLALLSLAFAADDIGGGDLSDLERVRHWSRLTQFQFEQAMKRLTKEGDIIVGQRHYQVVMSS